MIDGIITDKILDWKSLDIKPGGYLLVICKSNYHRITCNIENSGYEIRDMILYLPNTYITIARKPLSEKTVIENILKWGVGCININDCRIEVSKNDPNHRKNSTKTKNLNSMFNLGNVTYGRGCKEKGRFPANVIHSGNSNFPLPHGAGYKREKMVESRFNATSYHLSVVRQMNRYGDEGSASRFFYEAKIYQDLIKYLKILITPPNGYVYEIT